MSAILVASMIGVSFILIALFYVLGQDEETHYALKVILLAFILGIIVLLGKVSIDEQNYCDLVVSNSTVSGNTTSYSYDRVCEVNANSTASAFYNITLWVMRLVTLYLIISFSFQIFNYFNWKKKGGEQQ